MSAKQLDNVRAMASDAGGVAALLRAKLMAELSPEQRDMLSVMEKLVALNDAVFAGEPMQIIHRPPTKLSHSHILAEVQYGQQLLTGCDWREIRAEDRGRSDAAVERAGIADKLTRPGRLSATAGPLPTERQPCLTAITLWDLDDQTSANWRGFWSSTHRNHTGKPQYRF